MPSSRRLPGLHQNGTIMLHSEPLPERSIAALTLAEFPLTTCPRGLVLSALPFPRVCITGWISAPRPPSTKARQPGCTRARTGSELDCNRLGTVQDGVPCAIEGVLTR